MDYVEAANINDRNASNELMKFVKNSQELKRIVVREKYSAEVLNEHNGNAIFVPESNRLSLSLINHLGGELIDVPVADTGDILLLFLRKCPSDIARSGNVVERDVVKS